jgi:pyruvate/oxaloacetate carboxyltransferase
MSAFCLSRSMSLPDDAPLILTLALDATSQAYFNDLRQQYFPPKVNYLAAHLTLFHHLPGGERAAVSEQLRQFSQAQKPLLLQVAGLRSLGRGVAFNL